MKLVTANQMQEIDRVTIEERGIAGFSLMEHAGGAVADEVTGNFEPGPVAVACGKGNNAGDGFVVARILDEAGFEVHLLLAGDPDDYKGDAKTAWEKCQGHGTVHRLDEVEDLQAFFGDMDVVVDGLLGTGIKGKPRPPFDKIIEVLNASPTPVVAIDLPSGLNADTGEAELAVKAFRTVTIGLPKVGLVSGDGPIHCGAVRVDSNLFPEDLLEGADTPFHTLTTLEASDLLPERPINSHKGTFGLLVVAAGSEPMPGASVLVGIGATRGGCGLVRMLLPAKIRRTVASHLPEVIFANVKCGRRFLCPFKDEEWEEVLQKATALAVGPGMSQSEDSRNFLAQVLERADLPTVLDADALNILSEAPELRGKLGDNHLITPHPGELSRLIGMSAKEIQSDRWSAARRAAEELKCPVLLKGYGSLIAEPGGKTTHIPSGNSAWARGGAGDILTGLIGSLMAQGMPPVDAACLGAFVHGMAADIYAEEFSPRGATITDLAEHLPMAFRELEETQG